MDILIDSQIRDWVFLPLIFVMFMVGIFRYFLSKYTQNSSVPPQMKSKKSLEEFVDKFSKILQFLSVQNFNENSKNLQKAQKIVMASGLLTKQAFYMRRQQFCKQKEGILYKYENQEAQNPMANMQNMMMNSNVMMDMLKNNLSMGISTMLQFAWVSYFFSGFVLAQVPFQLTQKFRQLLQRGIEIQNLDVRYVSSLSLYFLILIGLNGLQSLILGDGEDAEKFNEMQQMQMQQMNMMPMGQGQPPDFKKLYQAERDNIELVKHEFVLTKCESLLIQKMKEKLSTSAKFKYDPEKLSEKKNN